MDLLELEKDDFNEGLVKTMTQKMDANYGYLIHPGKDETLLLHSGYNLADDKNL